MYTNDEWRRALGQPHMTDEEVEAFRAALRAFLNHCLDDYFREELGPDFGNSDLPRIEHE